MAKVAILRCDDYTEGKVFNAVKNAVGLIGGIDLFVKPGMNVLLKPNLLSPHSAEEAVTTHPEVIRAVARAAKEAGGIVSLGDSPGGYGNNIDDILEKSGVGTVAAEEGIEIKKFTTSKHIEGIPISRHILDADCVISIPKLKTHSVTVLTAAVKNMFGSVVGLYKAECHSRAPKGAAFADIIARIYSMARPHLTVVDGILGMEGDGPSAGAPRKINAVIAGSDAVAIDACIAKIIGIKPLDVPITKAAYAYGLGEADMSFIKVLGDNIEDFVIKDFKLPQTTLLSILPMAVLGIVASLVKFKPYIDGAVCRRCNLCKTVCQVNCIRIEKGYCGIDYKKCIRCLCCHEICPYKAIGIKRNILTKMVWG